MGNGFLFRNGTLELSSEGEKVRKDHQVVETTIGEFSDVNGIIMSSEHDGAQNGKTLTWWPLLMTVDSTRGTSLWSGAQESANQ